LEAAGLLPAVFKYLSIFERGKPSFGNLCRNNVHLFREDLNKLLEFNTRAEALGLSFTNRNESIGKLSLKEEAAGKVRVFAMVDGITQSLFYPLHKYLFRILKMIPNDSTFDQIRGINRIKEKIRKFSLKKVYSFDLSAATDRLPIDLQVSILNLIVGNQEIGPL